ncbi:MAG: helix-turn-helix domain-containing protein [Pseudomonadota bacterium]
MDRVDAIFKALSDETRRQLLDELHRQDGQNLGELERAMEKHVSMTRFGIMKHLKVLEDAALVVTRKSGRFKHHYLNAVPLQEVIDRWIEPLMVKPAARGMLDLKAQLERDDAMPDPSTDAAKPDFVMSTYIHCSQDALWDALINADAHGQYDFLAASCTRDGNALTYRFPDGSLMLVCRETEVMPKTRIESTFEPHWAGPETDLEASRFVYLIEPQEAFCRLTLEHFSIPAGQEDVADGWARTLAGLKTWLETGKTVRYSDHAGEH